MGDGYYIDDTNTREGSPLTLQLPENPGEHELRNIMNQGNAIMASPPITVDAVSATLKLAETAVPGANLVITWQGPDCDGDYLTISRLGEDGYETCTNTRDGSPTVLKVPDRPGDYEV